MSALWLETLLAPYLIFLRSHAFFLSILPAAYLGTCAGALLSRRMSPAEASLAFLALVAAFFAGTLALAPSRGVAWNVTVYGVLLAMPFACFGAAACRVLDESPCFSRTYALHLAGCATGALLAIAGLGPLSFERSVLLALLIAMAAAACFERKWLRWLLVVMALAVLVPAPDLVRAAAILGLPAHKPVFAAGPSLTHTRWDPVGRVDVGSDLRRSGQTLFFDGHPFMAVAHSKSLDRVRAIPLLLFANPKVLIIGSGGGQDIAAAAHFSDRITAVEISPGIVELMQGPLSAKTGRVYAHARVVNEDGRRFLSETRETFDFISLVCVNFPGIGNVYRPRYLYTREALRMYLDKLTPSGVLMIARGLPSIDILRIIDTMAGVVAPGERLKDKTIVLLASASPVPPKNSGILLVKKDGFTRGETQKILTAIPGLPLELLYAPGHPKPNLYSRLLLADSPQQRAALGWLTSPTLTDDRPYFFYTSPGLPRLDAGLAALGLLALLAVSGAWRARAVAGRGGILCAAASAAAMGCAAMSLQLTLIQRFTLASGSAGRAFAFVVCATFLPSGVASLLWGGTRPSAGRRWSLCGAVALLAAALLVSDGLGAHGATMALLPCFSLAAGAFFPTLLSSLRRREPESLYWLWGAAMAGGVMGSALFLRLSIDAGIGAALRAGAAAYAVACLLWLRTLAVSDA